MPHFNLAQFRSQLIEQLRRYRQFSRSRRQLLTLDDRLLKDIGITRAQAQQEGHKAFWKQASLKKKAYENR